VLIIDHHGKCITVALDSENRQAGKTPTGHFVQRFPIGDVCGWLCGLWASGDKYSTALGWPIWMIRASDE
jgi:hypothetical protein